MLSLKRTKLTMLLMERLTVITSIFDPVCFTHIFPGNLMIFRDFFLLKMRKYVNILRKALREF